MGGCCQLALLPCCAAAAQTAVQAAAPLAGIALGSPAAHSTDKALQPGYLCLAGGLAAVLPHLPPACAGGHGGHRRAGGVQQRRHPADRWGEGVW